MIFRLIGCSKVCPNSRRSLAHRSSKTPEWAPIELADFDNWAPAAGTNELADFGRFLSLRDCRRRRKTGFKICAMLLCFLRTEVNDAIVDNTVGGHLPPYYIPETRPAKPQASSRRPFRDINVEINSYYFRAIAFSRAALLIKHCACSRATKSPHADGSLLAGLGRSGFEEEHSFRYEFLSS
jgi:hypothetical protein